MQLVRVDRSSYVEGGQVRPRAVVLPASTAATSSTTKDGVEVFLLSVRQLQTGSKLLVGMLLTAPGSCSSSGTHGQERSVCRATREGWALRCLVAFDLGKIVCWQQVNGGIGLADSAAVLQVGICNRLFSPLLSSDLDSCPAL